MAELDVVTGAFSYTGRHIAEALLARGRRVRTLTRRPDPSHPLAARVDAAPFVFDDSLAESLRGVDTLYNTYWVRFERGSTTFEQAVANTARLFRAAKLAGVRRVVHISVANPDPRSPFPYFRGKAQTEEALRESGLSYAIVRPTLVFGPEDILVNNIAWGLRHVPLFLLAGDGQYEVQPVSVRDTARICVEAGARDDDAVLDAAGPVRWSFEDFVRLIARAVGGRAWIRHAPPAVALGAGRIAGLALRDVVLTRDELDALMAGLLVSHEPPLGRDRFDTWVTENARLLGRRYTSELARNFRGHV
ncbi:MAG: epimerase [Actinobacteria bacterium RBG_16_68_12]|nr:MAG: epimerase [Actinobacteria bacterium RBG_16_68_12]